MCVFKTLLLIFFFKLLETGIQLPLLLTNSMAVFQKLEAFCLKNGPQIFSAKSSPTTDVVRVGKVIGGGGVSVEDIFSE